MEGGLESNREDEEVKEGEKINKSAKQLLYQNCGFC